MFYPHILLQKKNKKTHYMVTTKQFTIKIDTTDIHDSIYNGYWVMELSTDHNTMTESDTAYLIRDIILSQNVVNRDDNFNTTIKDNTSNKFIFSANSCMQNPPRYAFNMYRTTVTNF